MTFRLGSLLVMLMLAAPAAAQQTVDVSRLPVDLERIHKVLKQSTVREERDGLNLRYQVEVFGQAPPLELFIPGESLTTGPVPNTAPTHREFVEHLTPKEYRSPPADFSALFRWLAERAKK
jgi:hypothetical protein